MFQSKESLSKFVQAFESTVVYSSNIGLLADYDMSHVTCDSLNVLYSSVQLQRNYIVYHIVGISLCEQSPTSHVRLTEVTVVSILSASNMQLKL